MGEIVDHIFAGRDVERTSFHSSAGLGETAVEHRLGGRDKLDHGRMAVGQVLLDRRIRVGSFIAGSKWPKKRCFALSKAERAADLACAFSVRSSPVMLAAWSAASRLSWMMAKASA